MQLRMGDHNGRVEWFLLDASGHVVGGGAVEMAGNPSCWLTAFAEAHAALAALRAAPPLVTRPHDWPHDQ